VLPSQIQRVKRAYQIGSPEVYCVTTHNHKNIIISLIGNSPAYSPGKISLFFEAYYGSASRESHRGFFMNEKTSLVVTDASDVSNLIYLVRGQQVMLDKDLARLYGVTTKVFKQQVKRNKVRFPDDFCFVLTEKEAEIVRSQFVTFQKPSKENDRYFNFLPYAFTEQGIAMLSGILRSPKAVEVNIAIMRSFVKMRRFLANNSQLFERVNDLEIKQLDFQKSTDERFSEVFRFISSHAEEEQKLFFEGQIYDAFSFLVSLIQKAEKSILLIDGYVDVATLNILTKKKSGVAVRIITKLRCPLTEDDLATFNRQYPSLSISYSEDYHDRFLILDDSSAYLVGASLKDAGKKCFALSLLRDTALLNKLLAKIG